ncbi:MAG: DUF924 domain-containing protein [Rhodospirillales bacterium]|nr:DUF924 domain-containing protein [Rhodospirillales bacterium]
MDMVEAVLEFWFGRPGSPDYGRPRAKWFEKDAAFDSVISARFHDGYAAAARGDLDGLMSSARGSLALAILLDQFPRNMFRGMAKAFAADAKARVVAGDAVANGFDRALSTTERRFLYLPFEHSEILADQDRSVLLFAALGDPGSIDYAIRHRDIIARFGRFPHRNRVVGRARTAAEVEFLARPGSSF